MEMTVSEARSQRQPVFLTRRGKRVGYLACGQQSRQINETRLFEKRLF